jgi:hypothetical protein
VGGPAAWIWGIWQTFLYPASSTFFSILFPWRNCRRQHRQTQAYAQMCHLGPLPCGKEAQKHSRSDWLLKGKDLRSWLRGFKSSTHLEGSWRFLSSLRVWSWWHWVASATSSVLPCHQRYFVVWHLSFDSERLPAFCQWHCEGRRGSNPRIVWEVRNHLPWIGW